MDIDYTITGIDKPSRQIRLTIHFQTGDKPMSYVIPDDVSSLSEARAFIEGKIKDAVMEWRRLQPAPVAPVGGVLDAIVGVRRTIQDVL